MCVFLIFQKKNYPIQKTDGKYFYLINNI